MKGYCIKQRQRLVDQVFCTPGAKLTQRENAAEYNEEKQNRVEKKNRNDKSNSIVMQLVRGKPCARWEVWQRWAMQMSVPQGQTGYSLLWPRAASNNLPSVEVKCWMEISHRLLHKLPVITGVQVLCYTTATCKCCSHHQFCTITGAAWKASIRLIRANNAVSADQRLIRTLELSEVHVPFHETLYIVYGWCFILYMDYLKTAVLLHLSM